MGGTMLGEYGADTAGEDIVSGLPLNKSSNVLASSIVCKTGRGGLCSFTVTNTNAAAQYILLFDSHDLPADGGAPVAVFRVAATSDRNVVYWRPRKFNTGLVLCNSSTAGTKTIGAADCFFDVQFY